MNTARSGRQWHNGGKDHRGGWQRESPEAIPDRGRPRQGPDQGSYYYAILCTKVRTPQYAIRAQTHFGMKTRARNRDFPPVNAAEGHVKKTDATRTLIIYGGPSQVIPLENISPTRNIPSLLKETNPGKGLNTCPRRAPQTQKSRF